MVYGTYITIHKYICVHNHVLCVCACAYSKEESNGVVEESNQNDKEQNGKYGADDSTHLYLFMIGDEGCGYDVGHQQEIHDKVEDQQRHGVLVLTKKITPISWLRCVKELQGQN